MHYKNGFTKLTYYPFFRSDHSPILVSYNKPTQISLHKVFWKFNSSLVQGEAFILKIKEHIKHIKTSFHWDFENIENVTWVPWIPEILQLVILELKQNLSVKNLNEIKKLKVLKQNLNNEETKLECNNFKDELNDIYEEISNGTRKTSSLSKYFT